MKPEKFKKILNSEVQETIEYDVFTKDERNRPVNQEKVAHFVKQFKKGKFFMKEFPAIVNEDFVILDGQHRHEAVKLLKLPFYFRFTQDFQIEDVVEVQSNAGWSPNDYIHAFIKQGKSAYIVLNRFIKKYNIAPSTAVSILTGARGMKKIGFYEGSLKITDEAEVKGHKMAEAVFNLGDMCGQLHKDRSFCIAVIKVMDIPDFSMKRMINAIETWPALMKRQTSTTDYVKNLEEVYNYHVTTKNRVRFF